nr:immunoglobulin light chain junction region [Macaca mulatta]MOV78944.1 immunoglobulin light chain junction region [Macaca mulatta]MOV78999.1 immunoglobulin light chain junction region [Macaca mulatta]MOV79388.1 immunoglobulin light chain junction region [Macaca mulatta]MOV80204.1 immunoglobulin light chain junction region [Macaca mulatta]
CQQVYSNPAF